MLRYVLFLHMLLASPVTAQIVTSPVELIDNSPARPGLIIVNAKTTPPVRKG